MGPYLDNNKRNFKFSLPRHNPYSVKVYPSIHEHVYESTNSHTHCTSHTPVYYQQYNGPSLIAIARGLDSNNKATPIGTLQRCILLYKLCVSAIMKSDVVPCRRVMGNYEYYWIGNNKYYDMNYCIIE